MTSPYGPLNPTEEYLWALGQAMFSSRVSVRALAARPWPFGPGIPDDHGRNASDVASSFSNEQRNDDCHFRNWQRGHGSLCLQFDRARRRNDCLRQRRLRRSYERCRTALWRQVHAIEAEWGRGISTQTKSAKRSSKTRKPKSWASFMPRLAPGTPTARRNRTNGQKATGRFLLSMPSPV